MLLLMSHCSWCCWVVVVSTDLTRPWSWVTHHIEIHLARCWDCGFAAWLMVGSGWFYSGYVAFATPLHVHPTLLDVRRNSVPMVLTIECCCSCCCWCCLLYDCCLLLLLLDCWMSNIIIIVSTGLAQGSSEIHYIHFFSSLPWNRRGTICVKIWCIFIGMSSKPCSSAV